jgi:hypothetical protein
MADQIDRAHRKSTTTNSLNAQEKQPERPIDAIRIDEALAVPTKSSFHEND